MSIGKAIGPTRDTLVRIRTSVDAIEDADPGCLAAGEQIGSLGRRRYRGKAGFT